MEVTKRKPSTVAELKKLLIVADNWQEKMFEIDRIYAKSHKGVHQG